MNIVVNAMPLLTLKTGIGRYMRSLYRAMGAGADVGITFFSGFRAYPSLPPEGRPELSIRFIDTLWKLPDPLMFAARSLHFVAYEAILRKTCGRGGVDLYHETGFVPARIPGIPVVYNIYDLSLLRYREMHPRERVWFSDHFLGRRLGGVAHILTISEFVKSEIIDEFRVDPDRVTAVPLAPDPVFYPRCRESIDATLDKNGWPHEYLLFVGSLEPRKNLSLFMEALAGTKEKIPVILAGWYAWGDKKWIEKIKRLGLEDRVHFAGYVDDETLARLYSGAMGFVYPSLYEGFGLPVLEAMACGAPVICSNGSSLPGTAGDAALLTDPGNVEGLASCINRLVRDSRLRSDLREKGLLRAARFTWEKSARETLGLFHRIVRNEG